MKQHLNDVATKASKILKDNKSTKNQKYVAGSALTQTKDNDKKLYFIIFKFFFVNTFFI